ncbi:MAG TPA: N-acetylmuramoyl-L-alanine amidase [Acidimicrobiales bacterium]|nr:N-acetylmuramoyl-L-alanine amidase [Acidimicrobiales bacterium]
MVLRRVWIPSPNVSQRSSPVRLIVVHSAEGGSSFEGLGNYFSNPATKVSSHVGIDDKPGVIGEYVKPDRVAWAQGNANGYSVCAELLAYARWSRDEWLRHPAMLANTGAWIAEEAQRFGLPIVKVGAGGRGVCGHVDLSGPGGHWDPGPGFPWDVVIAAATGAPVGPPPPPPPPGDAPPWPGRHLDVGVVGDDVRTWQAQMARRGWNILVDGTYGPGARSTALAFQREKGLDADGVVGEATWNATWNAPVAGGTPAQPPFPGRILRVGVSGEDVRQWQTQMAARGWTLDADGEFGPRCRKVVTDFQTEKGLEADGEVGPATWAAAWQATAT